MKTDMSKTELAELARTVADFEDCGETETAYHTLLRWAQMDLLEVENFFVTEKCRQLLANNPVAPAGE